MEKPNRILLGWLLDLYGELLTPHQREIGQLYWQEDWSLAEISHTTGVTRSAVHDLLERTERLLTTYEQKLRLRALCQWRQQVLEELGEALHEAPCAGDWKARAVAAYQRLAAEEGMADV